MLVYSKIKRGKRELTIPADKVTLGHAFWGLLRHVWLWRIVGSAWDSLWGSGRCPVNSLRTQHKSANIDRHRLYGVRTAGT